MSILKSLVKTALQSTDWVNPIIMGEPGSERVASNDEIAWMVGKGRKPRGWLYFDDERIVYTEEE